LTVTVYKQVLPTLRAGISRSDCRTSAAAAFRALEVDGAIDFQFGIATALPHGGQASQTLWEGDVVLMDGGCTVEGYHSDVSRTIVFGSPTQQQREVWDLAKRAQAAAFAAAQPGIPCEAVDAAARKVILDAGLGPEYEVPGLPHRTGHGIGLEIHEPEHMVHGNTTPLAAGMCFTDEPMIVVPGAFGIRLEDCVCVTGDGPRWFTQPSPSIEQPFT
jgi:Xaa-Pro dipeptidase